MALDYRYHYSDQELREDYQRLCRTTQYKTGSQFRPGILLCQHFMPNFWLIQNRQGRSFAQAWQDPVIMDRVREWGLRGMSQLWLSWIRRAVYLTAGLANSSLYRPHLARQIVQSASLTPGTLFDPCAGWGGRLLGTVSTGWRYVACEPNPDTYANLERMVNFLGVQDQVELHCVPVEQFDLARLGTVDVVLTSPPYFDLEIYTAGADQSYNQFGDWQTWRDQWFEPLVMACQRLLPVGGWSCWNVMNHGRCDMVSVIEQAHAQWQHVTDVGFRTPLANLRKLKNTDVTRCYQRV